VGGEVVIHLHAIVDAIALLGHDFTPTQAEIRRALRTKADRLFWFDQIPDKAVYDGKFNAPMLWNSNFFMTVESMKILRVLTDVWLPDFKFGNVFAASSPAKPAPSITTLVFGCGMATLSSEKWFEFLAEHPIYEIAGAQN
jgi:putative pyruvate formate lyase activating enzyme